MTRSVLGLVLVSGCIKGATEEPSETPPTRNEAVHAAQPEQKAPPDAVLASLDEEQAAYFRDCRHRFQLPLDEGGDEEELVDECSWLSFDQNCAPDPGGCWEGGQQCQSNCASACVSCDDVCGNGCEDCKAKCAEADSECVATCATARLECRDRCMADKSTCVVKTCPEKERACYDAHEALVKKKCPRCEQIRDCIEDAINGEGDPMELCGRKFSREPDECIEWCGMY